MFNQRKHIQAITNRQPDVNQSNDFSPMQLKHKIESINVIYPKTFIIGIFSNANVFHQDRILRDAYRTSIAKSNLTFNLKLFFFVGSGVDVTEENATHYDILQGSFVENLNKGKSLEWFKVASRMHGHYVIKMDQDTVVEWSQLSLIITLRNPIYFGTRVYEWGLDPNVSPIGGQAPSNQCTDFSDNCWFYMSGGFYGVSMDVARAIADCEYASFNNQGHEDAITGSWMRHCFPSVRGIDLPNGRVHYHDSMHKQDMQKRIIEQNIIHIPTFPMIPTVSVYLTGRLGNQMFQAASSYGIAVYRGASWCIHGLQGSMLEKSVRFHIQPATCSGEVMKLEDKADDFLRWHQPMMHGTESIEVGPFLQSYRYFTLSGLPFEPMTLENGREWVSIRNINVGIHIRRTDQLSLSHGGQDPGVWYFETALAMLRSIIDKEIIAVVCTDDVEWVKHHVVFNGMHIRDGTDPPQDDMGILAACEHAIISIGTFGWWAAYLRNGAGETFYYATPFAHKMDYYEHFPTYWTPISDLDIKAYITSAGSNMIHSSITDQTWKSQLHDYVVDVHRLGLSVFAKPRPRWVIADIHPLAGMCNRIMHILSTMAFAMATGRVLLFDWDETSPQFYNQENIGHSTLKDIFLSPPFQYSYKHAKEKFGDLFELHSKDMLKIVHDNTDFLHALRESDVDSRYPQAMIQIERFDWWATPLIQNSFYSSVFCSSNSSTVFSVLFKFLFRPLQEPKPIACDWLIQRRSEWDRETAPLDHFLHCAAQNGMKDRDSLVLISDSEVQNTHGMTVLSRGCRNGLSCDRETVNTMYKLSQCPHVVLTHTSTFGACITGLWQIADVYLVHKDGICNSKHFVDPIESGVLEGQAKQISTILDNVRNQPKFAFVYVMVYSSDQAIENFGRSMVELHDNFNHKHHYAILIFVNDISRWRHVQFISSSRVHVIQINQTEWNLKQSGPEIFYLKSAHLHPGFSRNYRQMSRFAAGFLFSHPVVSRYDYVIKLDSDTYISSQPVLNPFSQMYKKKAKIGVWISYSDIEDVTEHLWDTFVSYVTEYKLKIRQPGLLMDSTGKYKNTNFYGSFIAFNPKYSRSKEYKHLFDYFDKEDGFMKYRWDEQKLFAFYAALYLEEGDVEHFDYIDIEHQGTRDSRYIEVHNVSYELLQRIFQKKSIN